MFKFYFNEQIHEVSHKQVINPKKEDYANHMHTYCEMILFLSGDVDYNIDGNIYKPKKDDLMFIPKDTYHCLMPKVDTVYENYVLSFSADVFTSEEYEKIFSYPLVVNIKDDLLISDFFQKLDLYNELFSTDDFKKSAFHLIYELLTYCCYLNKENSSDASNNPIVDEIISYISQNLKEPLNAEMIAEALNLSKSHVQNIFSEKMNVGLKQYILKRKIFAARNDIKSGKKPVEVSEDYGFDNYSNFYRAYKKIFGYSPKTKK